MQRGGEGGGGIREGGVWGGKEAFGRREYMVGVQGVQRAFGRGGTGWGYRGCRGHSGGGGMGWVGGRRQAQARAL